MTGWSWFKIKTLSPYGLGVLLLLSLMLTGCQVSDQAYVYITNPEDIVPSNTVNLTFLIIIPLAVVVR